MNNDPKQCTIQGIVATRVACTVRAHCPISSRATPYRACTARHVAWAVTRHVALSLAQPCRDTKRLAATPNLTRCSQLCRNPLRPDPCLDTKNHVATHLSTPFSFRVMTLERLPLSQHKNLCGDLEPASSMSRHKK